MQQNKVFEVDLVEKTCVTFRGHTLIPVAIASLETSGCVWFFRESSLTVSLGPSHVAGSPIQVFSAAEAQVLPCEGVVLNLASLVFQPWCRTVIPT